MRNTTKTCNTCKTTKTIINFYFRKDTNTHRGDCQECRSLKIKKYGIDNHKKIKKKNKDYYELNKYNISIKSKAYYEKNRENIIAQTKEYYRKNKEKIDKASVKYREKNRSKRAKYRKDNKEAIAKQYKIYMQTPHGKAMVANKAHKRRTANKHGDVTNEQLLGLQSMAVRCYWCNTVLKNKKTHIDHYEPLSRGGRHTIENLVISCAKCNLRKGKKDPLKFANKIGKLF